MGLQETIRLQLKDAMKAKDTERMAGIRILIGEFQRQPEKELSDEQVIGIIKKLIKSEKELLAATGEQDSEYIAILSEYLPKQASEAEIVKWITENIDFSTFNNKMQAMRPIMAHFGSAVDGNTVKQILQGMD